nr:hypothetical protein [Tanacetum cinerariifolium]
MVDEGEDEDFKCGAWVNAIDYLNANGGTVSGCLGDIKNFLKKGKLDEVIAIVKSCSSNVLSDLTVSMKDLSSTIPETIHHKVIGESGYGKNITQSLNIEKPPMPPISSYLTVEESTEEYGIGDEYLTEGYLTKKELHQLMLDEEALREKLEEEARAQKEFDEINKKFRRRSKERKSS